jgi:hypothetical protein
MTGTLVSVNVGAVGVRAAAEVNTGARINVVVNVRTEFSSSDADTTCQYPAALQQVSGSRGHMVVAFGAGDPPGHDRNAFSGGCPLLFVGNGVFAWRAHRGGGARSDARHGTHFREPIDLEVTRSRPLSGGHDVTDRGLAAGEGHGGCDGEDGVNDGFHELS